MAAYLKQKRASPGMVQASDLQITRPKSAVRAGNRDVHGYDGPLHFISPPQNPDQLSSYHHSLATNNGNHTRTPQSNREIGKKKQQKSYFSMVCL